LVLLPVDAAAIRDPAAFDLAEGTVRTFQIALPGEPRAK
jgi:hypothetical protein